jgi:hypothetical protein
MNIKFKKIAIWSLLLASFLPVTARDSQFTRKGTGPMYWIAYEYCYSNDKPLPEDRYKKNIDWINDNFKNYGYDMICTDGWIEQAQTVDRNGYITKYNSSWSYDFRYWSDYIRGKGMKFGVYYNPMWLTRTACDKDCPVLGTNVTTKQIVGENSFNGDLYWVDTARPGAEQWIKGYVRHFINFGATYLRIDFLENYERNYGSEKYAQALKWIMEEAGNEIFVSLVMPNCFSHGKNEMISGDMIRISNDCFGGGWDFVSTRKRGKRQEQWPQYDNVFDGFIGFSDIAAHGKLIMDGDFMRINTMASVEEKKFIFSLMVVCGSALAIADQYDTIGDDALVYQNEELIELNRMGFYAKPLSGDIKSKGSSRWIGKLPNGDWVVGLFNREDTVARYAIDFVGELGINGGHAANVRDLWEHKDLGCMDGEYSVLLAPHSCKVIRIKSLVRKHF